MVLNERAVYDQWIDPERREEYLEAPEEVAVAMERAGAESFELYVEEDIAVCIPEAESIDPIRL